MRIIDAETGKVLEGKTSGDGKKYDGLHSCSCADESCGGTKDRAATDDVLRGSPIRITDGLALYDVSSIFSGGVETQVRPVPRVKPGENPFSYPHWGGVTHNNMIIKPGNRSFMISRSGSLENVDGVSMHLSIESGERTKYGLAFGDKNKPGSALGLTLDEFGKVKRVWTNHDHSILNVLGVEVEPEDLDKYNQARVEDPFRRLAIADGVAKAIGFDRWRSLDLRQTASNAYATMQHPTIDPSAVLAFQS